jgi:hypothetical protein
LTRSRSTSRQRNIPKVDSIAKISACTLDNYVEVEPTKAHHCLSGSELKSAGRWDSGLGDEDRQPEPVAKDVLQNLISACKLHHDARVNDLRTTRTVASERQPGEPE